MRTPAACLHQSAAMLLTALCFVWAGMTLGISFLETPVKFTAPSVTLLVGLDIGRHVFGMFNKVEIIGAVLAGGLIILAHALRTLGLPVSAVILVVILQTGWLLPLLDARVGMILAGRTPPGTSYHLVYILLELLKLICLMAAGTKGLQTLQNTASAGKYTRQRSNMSWENLRDDDDTSQA